MNISTANHDPRPKKHFQHSSHKTSACLSSAFPGRASLADTRRAGRPKFEALLWLLLGAGCVLWPLTQTYQQTTAFVGGSGLEQLACQALCNGAGTTPCTLAGAGNATHHGQATVDPATGAPRFEQTAAVCSIEHSFPIAAWDTDALSSVSLR